MGKFIIHTERTQQGEAVLTYTFELIARNGNAIATSNPFSNLTACKKCIQSVMRVVERAKLQDLCPHGKEILAVTNPKFELYKDKSGAFRFRLKARNGEVLLNSSAYTTKASCQNGIKSVITSAKEAPVLLVDTL